MNQLTREDFNCQFEWQMFLDNSKGLDVISLLVKYYAHINKLQRVFLVGGALSIAPTIRNTANS